MGIKTSFTLGVLSLALAVAPLARAQDKAACLDAVTKGQTLRDAHKLVEARDQFRTCAAASCPSVVQSDCVNFLSEVEKLLPTVVPSARSAAGADLADVKVTVDGTALTSTLAGEALPMNPGVHVFRFTGAAGATAERQVIVREGEKGQAVAVVMSAAASASGSGGAATPEDHRGGFPWRTLGWLAGGVGAVGIAVGSVSGILAMTGKGAHCASNNACDPGTSDGIKAEAFVGSVGLIAGGALLTAGAAMVLWAPREAKSAKAVTLSPTWTPSCGGAVLRGTF
jgi:hypothetical protein